MTDTPNPASEPLWEDEMAINLQAGTISELHEIISLLQFRLREARAKKAKIARDWNAAEETVLKLRAELEQANKAKSGSDYLAAEYLERANGFERLLKAAEAKAQQ